MLNSQFHSVNILSLKSGLVFDQSEVVSVDVVLEIPRMYAFNLVSLEILAFVINVLSASYTKWVSEWMYMYVCVCVEACVLEYVN